MSEENKTIEGEEIKPTTAKENMTASQYLEALKKLKSESVSKEEYEKLAHENEILVNDALKRAPNQIETPEEKIDIEALRKDIFSKHSNNLEFAKKTLKLRNELMKKGEPDPFLPSGSNIILDDSDYENAEKTAKLLEYCVEQANGSNSVFTATFKDHVADVGIPRRKGGR